MNTCDLLFCCNYCISIIGCSIVKLCFCQSPCDYICLWQNKRKYEHTEYRDTEKIHITCIRVYADVYIHICMCMCVYICIHIHIYVCIFCYCSLSSRVETSSSREKISFSMQYSHLHLPFSAWLSEMKYWMQHNYGYHLQQAATDKEVSWMNYGDKNIKGFCHIREIHSGQRRKC